MTTMTIKANIKKIAEGLYYEDAINPWYVWAGNHKLSFPSWEAAAAQLTKLAASAQD
jgi:hypothetical protein